MYETSHNTTCAPIPHQVANPTDMLLWTKAAARRARQDAAAAAAAAGEGGAAGGGPLLSSGLRPDQQDQVGLGV